MLSLKGTSKLNLLPSHMPSFENILRQFHDKMTAQNIADAVVSRPERLPELMECFLHEEMRICQRASWPMGMIGKNNTSLLLPYIPQLLAAIKEPKHDAVVRNTFRTFQFMDFPEVIEGEVFDVSLSFLMDINNAVAIRVFSMTVS